MCIFIIFSKLKIKKSGDYYIFEINKTNKFAINGTENLQNIIQDFYDKKAQAEKLNETEQVLIRIEGLKIEYITGKTKEELKTIKQEIAKNKAHAESADDIINVDYKMKRLINFWEVERDAAKKNSKFFDNEYDRKDDGLWKIHKAQIENRLATLYKIRDELAKISE